MKRLLVTAAVSLFALTACPSDEPDARDVLRNNGDSICKAYTDRDDC